MEQCKAPGGPWGRHGTRGGLGAPLAGDAALEVCDRRSQGAELGQDLPQGRGR